MSNDARYVVLARSLGLTPQDLAELCGCSSILAWKMATGRSAWLPELKDAVDAIDDDSFALIDAIIADAAAWPNVIWIFRNNKDLRRHFPNWRGRGQAKGGFVGPHSVAALDAQSQLAAEGIELEMRFYSEAEASQLDNTSVPSLVGAPLPCLS